MATPRGLRGGSGKDSMSEDYSKTVPSDEALDAAFKPYIKAAGEVVNAWNKMQEQLNLVFVEVTGMSKDMATSIWHSMRSDSLQRDMLLAAVDAIPQDEDPKKPDKQSGCSTSQSKTQARIIAPLTAPGC